MYKVAIIGSRSIRCFNIGSLIETRPDLIITGGATGVDQLAYQYAKQHGIACLTYFPDYAKYGKKAPLYRNMLIIKAADLIISIWDGRSTGTAFTIRKAKELGKPINVILHRHYPRYNPLQDNPE